MDKSQNERLTKVRESFNDSVTEFARKLGISQGTLSQMEKGERVKNNELMYVGVSKGVKKVLYNSLNVNKQWFETGNGDMFAPDDLKREMQAVKAENAVLRDENAKLLKELLGFYRKLQSSTGGL